MSILFASSHSIDFSKLAGTVNTASIPAAFDANYVKQCLRGNSTAACWRWTFPTAVTDHYAQFKQYASSSATSGSTRAQVVFKHFDGVTATPIVQVVMPGTGGTGFVNDVQFQYWNGAAWVNIGPVLSWASNTLYTFTFRLKLHASAGEFSFYANNTLIGQLTGNTLLTGVGAATSITYAEFSNPSSGTGASGNYDWAEFIQTANESPYAMKVKTHVLTGAGTTSDWTGAYTDVDEADPSTTDIISSGTANQVSTFTTDDLPAIGADVIRAVQVSAMARRGATGPQNIQMVLRASATDQTGTTTLLTTGYQTYRHIFEQNSVTGVEFTKAEIDASEVGVKSIT